jgi:hypothetical protein
LEAASKKRGRPKFREEFIKQLRGHGVISAKTNRAAQGRVYFYEGLDVLGINPDAPAETLARFVHLANWKEADRGARGALKVGALAEIGRAARQLGCETARALAEVINDAIATGEIRSAKDAELRLRAGRMRFLAERGESN